MGLSIKAIGSQSIQSPQDIVKVLKEVLSDLEDQLNNRGQLYVSTNGVVPAGLSTNDLLVILYRGQISLLIKGKSGFTTLTAEMIGGLSKQGTQYLGHKSASTAPVVADFPNEEDWGFYTHTTIPTTWICLNVNGVLKKSVMS